METLTKINLRAYPTRTLSAVPALLPAEITASLGPGNLVQGSGEQRFDLTWMHRTLPARAYPLILAVLGAAVVSTLCAAVHRQHEATRDCVSTGVVFDDI